MAVNDALIYFFIGSGAGILSGLFGIGGGVLIVPALMIFTGINIKTAYGTSLAALLLPVGILGCLVYYKERLLHIKAALAVALGITCSVGLGAYFASILGVFELKICYCIFLFYMGIKFINPIGFFRRKEGMNSLPAFSAAKQTADDLPDIQPAVSHIYWKCFGIGLLAGIISGFFGIGGGAIIVPLLALWLKFDTKSAIATSLGVLLPPIGLPGVLVYYTSGNLHLPTALWVAAGLLCGTIFGAKLTVRLPSRIIKAAYGVLLIATGIRFTLNIF